MSEPSASPAFSCPHCASPWFGAVLFCPYCGVANSLAPKAAPLPQAHSLWRSRPAPVQAAVPAEVPPIALAPAVPLPAKPAPAAAPEPIAVPAKFATQDARTSRPMAKASALLLAGLALAGAYAYWGRSHAPTSPGMPSAAPALQLPVTQAVNASPAAAASPSAIVAQDLVMPAPPKANPAPGFTAVQPSPQETQAESKSPLSQKANPIDVLQSYPIEAARQHLGEMLDAAKLGGNLNLQDQVQALAALRKPPRGDHRAALALSAQGSSALKSGNFEASAKLLEEALRLDPSDAEGLNSLAFVRLKQHQLSSARNAALASLLLLPTRTATWANLAFILAEDGKLGSASSAFYLAYHFSKDKPETQNYLQRLNSEDAASTAGLKEAASGALKLINR